MGQLRPEWMIRFERAENSTKLFFNQGEPELEGAVLL